ncbi:hypothetical protein Goklo_015731 [Gossypium klotzschianum]|uniref:Uncharacterized protein n=1 Tax=Gossypium klotzschianum TaxID=34286 RepID=A0A7J8UBW1_9ROSI|nr:hypothetical protein [Gossypium klotzschianum]
MLSSHTRLVPAVIATSLQAFSSTVTPVSYPTNRSWVTSKSSTYLPMVSCARFLIQAMIVTTHHTGIGYFTTSDFLNFQ